MILYFVAVDLEEERHYRGSFPNEDLRFVGYLDEVPDDAEAICIFVDTPIDEEFVDRHPALKFIATRSGSTDHIDLDACHARGIAVSYVPQYGETTVAEHTFALILALSRRLREALEFSQNGGFSYRGTRAFDLAHKTLGIIGLGRIGQRVAMFGRCFGMRVIAYDPIVMPAAFAQQHQVECLPLDQLLRQSHVVTLHARLAPSTRCILNADTLALCQPGALIVNTARGGLIDTAALEAALDSGHIGGAGLDVLEDERVLRREATEIISSEIVERLRADSAPEDVERNRVNDLQHLMTSHSILRRPNVVFTPHVAFNSEEAVARLHAVTVENIRCFIKQQPQNTICPPE